MMKYLWGVGLLGFWGRRFGNIFVAQKPVVLDIPRSGQSFTVPFKGLQTHGLSDTRAVLHARPLGQGVTQPGLFWEPLAATKGP